MTHAISSPTSVSTLLCLSVENKNGEMATFESQIKPQLIRKRPTQISTEKSQEQSEFDTFKPQQRKRAANDLIKDLKLEEIGLVAQYLEKVHQILKGTVQSTVSFKKFWSTEGENNQKVDSTFDSIMRLMGFNSHEEDYYSNDIEEILKEVTAMKEFVQVLEQYYTPFTLENMKPKLVHCFDTDEIAKKAYSVLKLKNLNDLLEDMKVNISDNGFNLTRGQITLSGDFNLVYHQDKQGEELNDFITKITQNIKKGENTMLLSIGATGSGKSETFFKGVTNKKERGDEAIVLHILEKLIDMEAELKKESSVISFECQYMQVFNEALFDLLKKEEKEGLEEKTEQTNLNWLSSTIENCTNVEITDKLSIRKMMKRAQKNRALLTVQNKIFERRSTYLLKCHYKVKIGGEEKEADIVFCEMPGSEKLTQNEKDSLNNMRLDNKLFQSKAEFTEFWIQSYPTRRKSMLMTILDPNFLRNCEMMVISHISLNREAFDETVSLFRFLKHFNETISIDKQSKEAINTNQDLSNILTQYEKMRTLLSSYNYSEQFVKGATSLIKEIEALQTDIMSKCFRLSPAQLENALKKIPELSNMSQILQKKPPTIISKPKIENLRKNAPNSLCEIASVTDSKRLYTNQNAKSLASPTNFLESNGFKRNHKITQDPLYQYIDEISETDFELYKTKLGSEGRCAVCTLKNCEKHSKSAIKPERDNGNLAFKPQERVGTANRLNSRERQRPSNPTRPQENSYDPENINPDQGKGNMPFNNAANTTMRKFKRAESLQCDPVVVRDNNLDKSLNDIEMKPRKLVNQSMVGGVLGLAVENYAGSSEKTKLEEISGVKLSKQLKLEEYHERKILGNIRNIKDKKMMEELYKRDTEIMEDKKRKYYDSQRKKLEEMRKIKTEEKRKERQESEQKEKEEMRRKKKSEMYYKKLKEKLFSYKQKIVEDIILSAENKTQEVEEKGEKERKEEEDDEYEAIFEKEDIVKMQFEEPIVSKVLSYPSSAQKTIGEEILDLSKGNESVEILEEEILEESINA